MMAQFQVGYTSFTTLKQQRKFLYQLEKFNGTGPEATMVCQDDQLCAGTKAGIDGTIHGVQDLWDKKLSTEEWVFLLVDAKDAFNKINRVGMLWAVQHL